MTIRNKNVLERRSKLALMQKKNFKTTEIIKKDLAGLRHSILIYFDHQQNYV